LPYVIRHKRWASVVAACLGLLVSAAPAAALPKPAGGFPAPPPAPSTSSCPTAPSSQVFSRFGDQAFYSLVHGGSFDGPLGGWSLSGASVVPGTQPLLATPGTQLLKVSPGGEVVSPTFCLSNDLPTWRFVLQSAGNQAGSALNVWAQWTDQNGNTAQVPLTALSGDGYSSWAPSPVLTAGSGLPDGATVNAQLVFSATPGDSWNVDDVYIDPYAR
jgi:hypothetical protein